MRIHPRVTYLILVGLCLPVWGCSLLFDPDDYVGKKKSGAGGSDEKAGAGGRSGKGGAGTTGQSGSSGGQGGHAGTKDTRPRPSTCKADAECLDVAKWICDNNVCFDCDKDYDGYFLKETKCLKLIAADENPDCNDTDPTIFPNAPAICDDNKLNDCIFEDKSPAALTQWLGVEEIGHVGAAVLAAPGRGVEYEIPISAATQLSLASGSIGSPEPQPGSGLLTFIDRGDGRANTRTARLVYFRFKDDGVADSVSSIDVNAVLGSTDADATIPSIAVSSIAIQGLSGLNSRVAVAGTKGELSVNTLWYTDIGSELVLTETPVSTECSMAGLPRPRIAVTATGMHWIQGETLVGSARAISYTNSAKAFACPALQEFDGVATPAYVDMTGSSGSFVIGHVGKAAFIWGGAGAPASLPEIVPANSRPALAYLGGNAYLASAGRSDGYEFAQLTCDPAAASAPCALVGKKQTVLGPFSGTLTAMDDLGDKGAFLALIEETSPAPGTQNAQYQEAVIRLFNKQGQPFGQTDFQDLSGTTGPSAAFQIPVFHTIFSKSTQDPLDGELRIVDLATSAWVDETNNSKYGFVILVAAIATTDTTVASRTEAPDPGDVILLSGLRGCRHK